MAAVAQASRVPEPPQNGEGNPNMSTYPPPGPGMGGFGQRIEEAIELIELELRHAVAYMNDAVVPQVRRESIAAMRNMSDTLRKLADRFEAATPPAAAPPRQSDPRQTDKDPRA